MPGRIHAAQIIQTICSSYKGVDFALSSFKLSKIMEPCHDSRHSFLNQWNQLLAVHVFRLPSRWERRGGILLCLLVPSNDFIPKHCFQNAINLRQTKRKLANCVFSWKNNQRMSTFLINHKQVFSDIPSPLCDLSILVIKRHKNLGYTDNLNIPYWKEAISLLDLVIWNL